MGKPTGDQEADFIRNLQYLLAEGEYVSTYKYALLIALTRWALEHVDHDEHYAVDVIELAPYVADLYWPHVQPFHGEESPAAMVAEKHMVFGTSDYDWSGILNQDRGQQIPKIFRLIRGAQAGGCRSLHGLADKERSKLLREVGSCLQAMPLWKLHKVRDRKEPIRFLYRPGPQRSLIFEPGIVACLANFSTLIEAVVRSEWLKFVLRYNDRVLAGAAQLEQFLFPGARVSLEMWRPVLAEVQHGHCFYCDQKIRDGAVIDHFLPWTRYPRDLGHNFVIAHATCNGSKSDHLAATSHLEKWCERNRVHGARMTAQFDADRLPHDLPASWRVAQSLYRIADASSAYVWEKKGAMVPLAAEWEEILRAHRPAG
jgi:hypothetical protein